MRAGRIAWAALAALGLVGFEAGLVGPRRLVTREVDLSLPAWPPALDGVRVALVADLHAGAPGVSLETVARVVRRTAEAAPDVVLLLGDYLADVPGGRWVGPAAVAAALAPLVEVAPVAAVLGNHDWYAGGYRVWAALRDAGIPVLENSALQVAVRGRPLWLAGVGDLWERRPDVADALGEVPMGAATLVLTHNPDCVVDVPEWVALTVAGHTHGGQIAVLGRPLHVVSPFSKNRFVRGGYQVGGRRLYVSSGIGTSSVPARLGVVPELTVLRLHPADE